MKVTSDQIESETKTLFGSVPWSRRKWQAVCGNDLRIRGASASELHGDADETMAPDIRRPLLVANRTLKWKGYSWLLNRRKF